MVCILKLIDNEIKGWIIANDLGDARSQIQNVSALSDDLALTDLSEELTTTVARPGMLALDTPGYILLVS